jgi:hypothetical protein
VHTDPLLGYSHLDGVGYVLVEISPYEADLTDFAIAYADTVRTDHALFVDAFREGRRGGVTSA